MYYDYNIIFMQVMYVSVYWLHKISYYEFVSGILHLMRLCVLLSISSCAGGKQRSPNGRAAGELQKNQQDVQSYGPGRAGQTSSKGQLFLVICFLFNNNKEDF